MASLSINNDEIRANLATILGVSRTVANWDPTLTADVNRIIRSGRRRFFSANDWSFLTQHISFVTAAPQDTGTVTAVDGVVTLTGATFPADVVDNYLFTSEGVDGIFTVESRDSATQITLHDTSVNFAALTEYALYKNKFDLPDSFGGFRGPVSTANNEKLHESAIIPEYQVRTVQNNTVLKTGRPCLFTVSQRISDEETGIPTWYLQIYPLSDGVYKIETDIRIIPGDTLGQSSSADVMHPAFSEAMAEAIYAAAEVTMGVGQGAHEARFSQLLPEAVRKDRAIKGVVRMLNRTDNHRVPHYEYITGEVTWDEEL
jgi:hypothetical protein